MSLPQTKRPPQHHPEAVAPNQSIINGGAIVIAFGAAIKMSIIIMSNDEQGGTVSMTLQETGPISDGRAAYDTSDPDAYQVQAATRKLGISRTTLSQLMAAGKLRSVKIAGRRVIPASELKRLVAEGAHAGPRRVEVSKGEGRLLVVEKYEGPERTALAPWGDVVPVEATIAKDFK
jgi:hypothetical protein